MATQTDVVNSSGTSSANRLYIGYYRTTCSRCHHAPKYTVVILAGAIGTMLRSRELESDVDEHLWGPATKVWGNAHG